MFILSKITNIRFTAGATCVCIRQRRGVVRDGKRTNPQHRPLPSVQHSALKPLPSRKDLSLVKETLSKVVEPASDRGYNPISNHVDSQYACAGQFTGKRSENRSQVNSVIEDRSKPQKCGVER
ncbi:hypothetical protein NQ318_007336 [Aromia moschata]|uniref:Uncharacterized protein n=1 Tax=Aromia moschata TaxID=1265417 RepID=A0AAV8YZ65_9CUCU|nr:hypothetical protein NQ318_007336 [Aromia moschata]